MFTSCVLREVAAGDFQYVPVNEVSLGAREVTYTGNFQAQSENLGPYGSHKRTICLPLGRLVKSAPCVLREVNPGDFQYVPARDVPVQKGERMFAGIWAFAGKTGGPYKSHRRTIALPQVPAIETRAAA